MQNSRPQALLNFHGLVNLSPGSTLIVISPGRRLSVGRVLAHMQDGPTYESWVVCLGTHQGFLASVHAEAKHPSQGPEM